MVPKENTDANPAVPIVTPDMKRAPHDQNEILVDDNELEADDE